MRARLIAVVLVALSLSVAAPARADFAAGSLAFGAGDFAAAIIAWRPLAEAGDMRAQFGLGVMLERGGAGVAPDLAAAREWYRRAAEAGFASAQFNLANALRADDPKAAVRWYRAAAAQGMASAQFNLGRSFETGTGVARDYEQAAIWYRRAAEQGDIDAQIGLAGLYRLGLGMPVDPVRALAWYRLAARRGDPRAAFFVRALIAAAEETSVAATEPLPGATAEETPDPRPNAPSADKTPQRVAQAVSDAANEIKTPSKAPARLPAVVVEKKANKRLAEPLSGAPSEAGVSRNVSDPSADTTNDADSFATVTDPSTPTAIVAMTAAPSLSPAVPRAHPAAPSQGIASTAPATVPSPPMAMPPLAIPTSLGIAVPTGPSSARRRPNRPRSVPLMAALMPATPPAAIRPPTIRPPAIRPNAVPVAFDLAARDGVESSIDARVADPVDTDTRTDTVTAIMVAKGDFVVQLGAYGRATAASAAWERLKRAAAGLLDDDAAEVAAIDLGAEKGVLYRLWAAPARPAKAAKTLCRRLKDRDIDCLVRRRPPPTGG